MKNAAFHETESPFRDILGSLRNDDGNGNGNDNATNHWFDRLNRKNNRAAREASFLVQMLDVVCQMTTWNFRIHIWGSEDNASPQYYILQHDYFSHSIDFSFHYQFY